MLLFLIKMVSIEAVGSLIRNRIRILTISDFLNGFSKNKVFQQYWFQTLMSYPLTDSNYYSEMHSIWYKT